MSASKFILASSTALTLSMSAAFAADGNQAYLDQTGNDHSALITQSDGDSNVAGTDTQNVTQNGFLNQLTILQSGDGNSIGEGANANAAVDGVIQQMNGSNPRAGAVGNDLSVTQTSDDNTVGAVSQTGSTTGVLKGNTAQIAQGDAAGDGDGNTVGDVTQIKGSSARNELTVSQTGNNNMLASVRQLNRKGGTAANDNEASVTMTGDNNGNGALTGFALSSGATSSNVIQGLRTSPIESSAWGSAADIIITGDDSEFGVTQVGGYNSIGTLTIGGNRNQVGTYQIGTSNLISVVGVSGDDNNIGMRQDGFSNTGSVDVTAGNGNVVGTDQTGSDNSVTVTIIGNDNGAPDLFSGNAATLGLTEGLLVQDGLSNIATLDVGGLSASNNNLFAMAQIGDDNIANGKQDGVSNQAALTQDGGNNVGVFSQNGTGNNAAISQ
ncbi:hypothetical protein [uncultured Sulfitobacter sp.]|uniref:hypothetical protein n=1 Tax=uncultured Sulfitobacter sp. TaxID=191468 RepID=UPI0026255CFF|nr:hypothetical protein [uncultured Sulfitobacter sp.]